MVAERKAKVKVQPRTFKSRRLNFASDVFYHASPLSWVMQTRPPTKLNQCPLQFCKLLVNGTSGSKYIVERTLACTRWQATAGLIHGYAEGPIAASVRRKRITVD